MAKWRRSRDPSRRPGRGLAALCLALAVAGCAQRGAITVIPEAARTGSVVEIFMATSRGATQEATIASRARSDAVRWGAFDISVPPNRTPGTVTWPDRGAPDPAADFLTVSARSFQDERAFLAAVNASLARRPRGEREVTVFVHGFNTNFAEGLYRHAQMVHDFRSPGVSVSYAWPSAANVRSYGFDRESALFARDGLERLLDVLARSDAEQIVLAGHSMGTVVVMETIRQMAIRGSDGVLGRIQAVVLLAPDLDPELFRSEVSALAPRVIPIYVSVSARDRALRVSGLLRGQAERLGSLSDTSRIASLPGVVVLDVTDVDGSGDPLNHFAVATSPAMISFISGLDRVGTTMLRDADRSVGVFTATLDAVGGASEIRLLPRSR
jgi:esterase/lipase superfamily enzyme